AARHGHPRLVDRRHRRHRPDRRGDDGVRAAAGGADDAHLRPADVRRVARNGILAAGRRHAREIRGIDMSPRTKWLIAAIAAIGFAFDSYTLLMLPWIVRPALVDLLHVGQTDPAINQWVGYLFYIPAVAGGIFGLLGGYLTDRFGPRRGGGGGHQ